MAYVAPSTRTTGTIISAAIWNSDCVANPIAINAGAIGIASQAALDFIYASSASQLARLAKGTGQQVARLNAAASAWEFASPEGFFLYANSGTTTNTSVNNIDTFAISGLTAKDALFVLLTFGAASGRFDNPRMYNSTDSITISQSDRLSTDGYGTITVAWIIRQRQTANTAIIGTILQQADPTGSEFTMKNTGSTFTTAWTGSWTLALRGLMGSAGTGDWSWAVYKLNGQ